MPVTEAPSEEECALIAILLDQSGLDLAEFAWYEPDKDDGCFRAWPFQWTWWRDTSPLQIDQCARALSIDTPIPTPTGWKLMGDLLPGDTVYDESGTPRTVLEVSQVRTGHDCFEVCFDDHTSIIADGEHLWLTWDKKARCAKNPNRRGIAEPRVRTTNEIAATLTYGSEKNHAVDVAGALQANDAPLPLDPYFVGLWLGDGSKGAAEIATADQWVLAELQRRGFEIVEHKNAFLYGVRFPYLHNRKTESVTAVLRRLGVLNNKHIPAAYLRASEGQRRALLAGLVDSDGHLADCGSCEVVQKRFVIAEGLMELLRSLGEKPRMVKKTATCNGVDCGPVYRISWRPRVNPALMPRKADRFFEPGRAGALAQRRIVDVRAVPTRPVRCITVDSPSHLFLAGEGMVPTHNSIGKTLGIQARAFVFPFCFPGQEMVVTAPELVHLEPITGLIERRFYDCRLGREIMPHGRSAVTHRPFQMNFLTGSRIIGRIPQLTGKGVKGVHPVSLELDEAQDYPDDGWTELIETLKRGTEGATWHAHGVTRGIRDKFYEFTQPSPDNHWKVHRITAIHRPNWSDEERQEKIRLYGSRDAPDYRRNVMGQHGDQTNPLFVLNRLMRCCDSVEESFYNNDEYQLYSIKAEVLDEMAGPVQEDQCLAMTQLLDFPELHRKYKTFWCGMDVGFTTDPSEILVFAEYTPTPAELKADEAAKRAVPEKGQTRLKLVTRINMQRISNPLQARCIEWVINFYKPKAFGMDKMQPVSEPVLTPSGWAPIGSLRPGDKVVGSDGKPTEVLGVYPQVDRRVMKVTCTDGSWTRCGPEHLWTVKHTQHRSPMVVNTEDLAGLVNRPGSRQWTIPMLSGPAELQPTQELPIDPYLLGALLGDGNLRQHSTRFSSLDEEILVEVEARLPEGLVLKHTDRCNYDIVATGSKAVRDDKGQFAPCNVLLHHLKELGLAGKHSHEKWIPDLYSNAGAGDRLLLLQGIMDTDGWVTVQGNSCHVGLRSASERLIQDTIALVESLGGSGRYRSHPTNYGGKAGRTAYKATIAMPPGIVPFRLSRKRDAVIPRTRNVMNRYVASVEPDGEEESVCIRVAAEDELYVTRHCLLTHNTGNGLGLFQDLQGKSIELARVVRGYNFSEKVVVDVDGTVAIGDHDDILKEAAIKSHVLEFSTDKLRELVDNARMMLPWDRDVIREFQGQTWSYSKAMMDAYGRRRRIFSAGHFHALDAARMAAMAHAQHKIEAFIEDQRNQEAEPILAYFMAV